MCLARKRFRWLSLTLGYTYRVDINMPVVLATTLRIKPPGRLAYAMIPLLKSNSDPYECLQFPTMVKVPRHRRARPGVTVHLSGFPDLLWEPLYSLDRWR